MPGVADAVFPDQGRGQLRGHEQIEGVRADAGEDRRGIGGGTGKTHLSSGILEGKRSKNKLRGHPILLLRRFDTTGSL